MQSPSGTAYSDAPPTLAMSRCTLPSSDFFPDFRNIPLLRALYGGDGSRAWASLAMETIRPAQIRLLNRYPADILLRRSSMLSAAAQLSAGAMVIIPALLQSAEAYRNRQRTRKISLIAVVMAIIYPRICRVLSSALGRISIRNGRKQRVSATSTASRRYLCGTLSNGSNGFFIAVVLLSLPLWRSPALAAIMQVCAGRIRRRPSQPGAPPFNIISFVCASASKHSDVTRAASA